LTPALRPVYTADMGPQRRPARLRVGSLVADPRALVLFRGAEPVPASRRSVALLLELVREPGRTLSKRELLERVWGDQVVGEEALTHAVYELRRALGDRSRPHRLIQTVHGVGYRWIGPPARPLRAPHRPGPRGRRVLAAAAVAVAVVVVMVAAGRHRAGRGERVPSVSRLLEWPGGAFKPAVSPDGALLAVVSAVGPPRRHRLFVVRPGAPGRVALAPELEVRGPAPVFSPDGAWVYFSSYGEDGVPSVWRVPALGGPAELVARSADAASLAPDGSRIVLSRPEDGGNGLWVRGPAGGERRIARRGYWPRWSPDGRWIAATTADPEGGTGYLFVVRPDGTGRRRLTEGEHRFYGLCWTPSSRGVVFAADLAGPFHLWVVSLDGGPPRRLTFGAGDDVTPAVAPGGREILFVNGRMREAVVRWWPERGEWETVAEGRGLRSAAVRRHDGAVAWVERGDGDRGVVRTLEGPTAREVGPPWLDATSVRWSPEGDALIVSGRARDGGWGVWRIPPDGEAPRALLELSGPCAFGSVAPGGGWTAAVVASGGRRRVVVGAPGRPARTVAAATGELLAPAFSPDASRLAWSGPLRLGDPGAAGVWVAPADGSTPPRRLVRSGTFPLWSTDRSLLFLRGVGPVEAWRTDVGAAGARLVARLAGRGWPLDADGPGPAGELVLVLETDTPRVLRLAGVNLP